MCCCLHLTCMLMASKYGRYLFADMYTSAMWTGIDNTDGSGKYTSTSIPFSCSEKTPIPCDESTNSPLGLIFSFGEDNKLDVFILSSQGVYRIIQPALCGYAHLIPATTEEVTPSGGSNGIAPLIKVLVSVLSVLAASAAATVAWTCFRNNTTFCCNDNVQVTNNNTMHSYSVSVTTAKPGDIELATTMREGRHGR